MRRAGFTIIELAASTAIFLVLLVGIAGALAQDARTTRVLVDHMGPERVARRVLDRVASDLQYASLAGEDLNGNGMLDDGEDTNENGVLEADWSLADGAIDQPMIRFNRREDEYNDAGYRTACGVYSGRITYRVVDNKLVREWRRIGFSGNVDVRSAVVAARVSGLRFSRRGALVSMEIDFRRPDSVTDGSPRTVRTTVRLLN